MRFLLYPFTIIFCLLTTEGIAHARQSTTESHSQGHGDKPNIIFILVDDMGWGDMGPFFQDDRKKENNKRKPSFQTPALTKLASEGVQMRRHYSAAPVCAPARASLLLGMHQGNARVVRDNTFDLPIENTPTLGGVLREAGYSTAAIGKWGVAGGRQSAGDYHDSSAYPTKRGFDFFFGFTDHISGHCHYPATDPKHGPDEKNAIFDCYGDKEEEISSKCVGAYSTDLFTARAKKWIIEQKTQSPDKPFFVYLAYTAPHAALQVPTQAYPAGGGMKGGLQWIGEDGRIINTANKEKMDSYIYPEFDKATYVNAGNKTVPWPDYAKRHATMLRRVDDAVADIRHLLKDLKIDENTLIVFTSDNGPHNEGSFKNWKQDPRFFESFGPFDGIKRDTWEGGLRVPTLVCWPRYTSKGAITEHPSQFHDWMATFADAAGITSPATCDGVSLLPTITGKGDQKKSTIYAEYCFGGKTPDYDNFDPSHRGALRRQEQVVYADGFKGVRYNIETHQGTDFRIYDIAHDPKEIKDLAKDSGFDKIQQKMKDKALQIRRVYDYQHVKRGREGSLKRPYDEESVPSIVVENTGSGLAYGIVEGRFSWVPNFESIRSWNEKGKTDVFEPSELLKGKEGAVEYRGYINIPEEGEYVFYLTTDKSEGSKAFMRLHGMQLVDADNDYTPGQQVDSSSARAATETGASSGKTPSVRLKAGLHPFSLGFVTRGTSPSLILSWKAPGSSEITPIPPIHFFHIP